ncbi:hypothetical protein J6590_038872 [Homalodisca vitripennis]|nr:hypothetical protein J6590_038872 [Homalodisca vitripennis]
MTVVQYSELAEVLIGRGEKGPSVNDNDIGLPRGEAERRQSDSSAISHNYATTHQYLNSTPRAIPKHPSSNGQIIVRRMSLCGVPFNKQASDLHRASNPSVQSIMPSLPYITIACPGPVQTQLTVVGRSIPPCPHEWNVCTVRLMVGTKAQQNPGEHNYLPRPGHPVIALCRSRLASFLHHLIHLIPGTK